jgi:O-antigen biosynthesis protein WbqV
VGFRDALERFAEVYCQGLDADFARRDRSAVRLIAVRLGNMLASNGSAVPKFKAQIEASPAA